MSKKTAKRKNPKLWEKAKKKTVWLGSYHGMSHGSKLAILSLSPEHNNSPINIPNPPYSCRKQDVK
jgi:hypothetical protein